MLAHIVRGTQQSLSIKYAVSILLEERNNRGQEVEDTDVVTDIGRIDYIDRMAGIDNHSLFQR